MIAKGKEEKATQILVAHDEFLNLATQLESQPGYSLRLSETYTNKMWRTDNPEITCDIPKPVFSMMMFCQTEAVLKVTE